jgi:hypothetical protein
MKQAELIAVGGFHQVLEDVPDKGSSESDSENSDHGDVYQLEYMYTSDMIGPDGKLLQGGPVKLRAEQAAAQRAQARLSISHPKGSTEFLSSSAWGLSNAHRISFST